jgi:hypothetical protein
MINILSIDKNMKRRLLRIKIKAGSIKRPGKGGKAKEGLN